MSREQSLRNGAGLMVLGAVIFLVYAVVFFFRAFASSGFEIGVETLNGVTPQQLDGLNPAIMGYITHLHVATAGFIAATAIAAGGLAWYGVRDGLWWAWIIAVVVPVVGLAVALPMHYMGHFNYDWVSHLGAIYLGRGGCGGVSRADPSGAGSGTSPAVDTAASSCSAIRAAGNAAVEDRRVHGPPSEICSPTVLKRPFGDFRVTSALNATASLHWRSKARPRPGPRPLCGSSTAHEYNCARAGFREVRRGGGWRGAGEAVVAGSATDWGRKEHGHALAGIN